MNRLIAVLLVLISFAGLAQTNVHFTNPVATNVLAGNYNPGDYSSSAGQDPHAIALDIEGRISADSLKS